MLSKNIFDDDINLKEIFDVLWSKKLFICLTTLAFAIASVIYALSVPNIYKADTLLAPAESSGGNRLSQMAAQFGGLAALAGVNLGGHDSNQTELAVQVMKSRSFVDGFIKKHDLLVPLMAAKGWDLGTNMLLIDDGIYNESSATWLREPSGLRGSKPSPQEAYETFIKNVLKVKQDKESGLYSVSIMHYSPYIAKEWVNWIVQDINKVMRERTISETSQNLEYLNQQLSKTAIADMQSTFYKLIEEQTKSLMLAEVQEEFVFKVIDPAVVPEEKTQPSRAIICILGTFLGGFLSCIIVLVLHVYRKQRQLTN
ncbi:lipopolysaccharide biosynthesis protein [Vibrio alginolyticus]|nr:lipopolysaccharide biosynthesis protein [Vibrio alginolyticus]EJU9539380.1 LPS O-antigen length regulator [Vibrio alginolyticus]ELA8351834.1 LPS O-antigen length regulator [Vibrio alginolyticus]ELA8471247.1 LPS O-antigen length regulator [Vibrio alginolyticus]MBS9976852.1 LPS O-antigen length regulator [Vibrio alginolyticus]